MPVTKPVPYKKSAMRARSVSPASVLSHAHEQKKNTKALIVMALVICLVVCFTLGVYYYLVYGSFQ
jgi:energy-coupling factor transporter transmembrane protein EcfT